MTNIKPATESNPLNGLQRAIRVIAGIASAYGRDPVLVSCTMQPVANDAADMGQSMLTEVYSDGARKHTFLWAA